MTSPNGFTTYITFPVSDELRDKIIRLNKGIREGDPQKQIPLLVEVGVSLAHAGIHEFLETPIELVELSPMLKKIAVFGIHTTEKAVTGVMKRIFTKLNKDQLRVTPVFLEHLMEQNEPREDLLKMDKERLQTAIEGRCETKCMPVEIKLREGTVYTPLKEQTEERYSFLKSMETRISGSFNSILHRLGFPSRQDFQNLTNAIDTLTEKVENFPAVSKDDHTR